MHALRNEPFLVSLDKPSEPKKAGVIPLNLNYNKAVGRDAIAGKMLKALAVLYYHLASCWSNAIIFQDLTDFKIRTLYKQRGDKGDCNKYQNLNATGKNSSYIVETDCL